MVWGCVYSPGATGDGSTRIAHYVGPDGFPQLQNISAAEYIKIHYDADGWEDRAVFLDALARPAPGPDGELGVERRFDRNGNPTSIVLLDEHGQPMIDHLGNAGKCLTYTAEGLLDEAVSVGVDGKPFAVPEGWTRIKLRYDSLGRRTRIEALDGDGRPVLRRSSFSAIEFSHDENGDIALETYLGTDGKPRALVGEIVSIRHEIDAGGNETRVAYLDAAGRPSRLRDGSCGYESRFDARGNIVAQKLLDTDGKPFLITDGYAGWQSEFDDRGREIRRTYQGVAGEPVFLKKGGGGWETRFDLRGNAARFTYLGADGRPAFATDQVAGWEAEFDQRGRETVRRYFGPAGESVVCTAGYHALSTSYDERGYAAECTYLDLAEKPFAPFGDNFATRKMRHDARGRETRRAFYNASDKPVANKDNVHGYLYQYDDGGNITATTTISLDNLPVASRLQPYARETRRYDARAFLVEQRYYDAAGDPAKNGDGIYGTRYVYNEAGGRTGETAVGAGPDDPPVPDKNGVVRRGYEFDGWGRLTKTATLGAHGEPVPGIEGACAKTSAYDVAGNWIGSTWLDASGKLTANRDGYAEIRYTYDEQYNQSTQAYFDAVGQPCPGGDKTHRWVKKFDARRNTLRWEWFGTQDRPQIGIGVYAATVMEYDARNDETTKTFLGVDGRPLVQKLGYATIRQEHAANGLTNRVSFYDAANQPALCEEGYCVEAVGRDAGGRIRTMTWTGLPGLTAFATEIDTLVDGLKRGERYLDAEGNPVNSSYGHALMNKDFDEAKVLQGFLFRDAQGKPTYGLSGIASADYVNGRYRYYDTAGELLRDIDHRSMRPLLCVNFVTTTDSVAARCGVRAGDLIWQFGDFFYPQLVADIWDKSDSDDDAETQISAACNKALGANPPLPARLVVIRQGQPVELSIAEALAGGGGMRVDRRKIPARDYDEMVRRYGKPTGGSATGAIP